MLLLVRQGPLRAGVLDVVPARRRRAGTEVDRTLAVGSGGRRWVGVVAIVVVAIVIAVVVAGVVPVVVPGVVTGVVVGSGGVGGKVALRGLHFGVAVGGCCAGTGAGSLLLVLALAFGVGFGWVGVEGRHGGLID